MTAPSPCDECNFYVERDNNVTFFCRYAMREKNRADFTCPLKDWPYAMETPRHV
jgi:hypothetical protein